MPATAFQRIDVETVEGVVVVTCRDKKIIEISRIKEMALELFQLAEQGNPRILLDFVGVDFMSSAFLSWLINLERRISAKNGKLVLCNVRSEIYEVFAITKLSRLFSICDARERALQVF